ncbi:hypothetical protein Y032_0122g1032 [Ancylostoma ceylanicum]|uniref:Uncharacterized protein n=1 Tax=Ancylostoma ceylanicum TaxID=53326 RepID=A0A016T9V0_9BILA|nr:hypothetical protein Y032_0122g1032 [Ancylostoma ceylanicum]
MNICIFSSCGQIVFGLAIFASLILTATATFYSDPGSEYYGKVQETSSGHIRRPFLRCITDILTVKTAIY